MSESHVRGPDTLTLLLYSDFDSDTERDGFMDLLRSAHLFMDKLRELPSHARIKKRETFRWLKEQANGIDSQAQTALFVWHGGLSLMSEDSSLCTILDLVKGLREAKLVYAVPAKYWDTYVREAGRSLGDDPDMHLRHYRWTESATGTTHTDVSLLGLKLGGPYGMRHVERLRTHLGTHRPNRTSQVMRAARREDETQEVQIGRVERAPKVTPRVFDRTKRSGAAMEVVVPGSEAHDARRDDEEERPTIEPPPPDPPKR